MNIPEESPLPESKSLDFEQLIVYIRQLHVQFQQICSLPPGELTMLILIDRIYQKFGQVSPSDLTRVFSLSRPAVSRMLHLLEKKGYISIKECHKDHRSIRISLNEIGRELIRRDTAACEERFKNVIQAIGKDDIKKMMEYNTKFIRALTRELMSCDEIIL